MSRQRRIRRIEFQFLRGPQTKAKMDAVWRAWTAHHGFPVSTPTGSVDQITKDFLQAAWRTDALRLRLPWQDAVQIIKAYGG